MSVVDRELDSWQDWGSKPLFWISLMNLKWNFTTVLLALSESTVMLPGLPGNLPISESLCCCLKWPDPTQWHVGAFQSPLVFNIIRDMHKHILKTDLFWYSWNLSKLFFPLNLRWRQRYWLSLWWWVGQRYCPEERLKIPEKALSHTKCLVFVYKQCAQLLPPEWSLKRLMDCCLILHVWGKFFGWCEVFLKFPQSMWKTLFDLQSPKLPPWEEQGLLQHTGVH